MSLRNKKIEDEFIAKKVRTVEKKINKKIANSKSTFRFKSNKTKENDKIVSNKSNEVVVKITSSGKSYNRIKSHLDYISRNGKIEILTNDGEVLKSSKERHDLTGRFYEKLLSESDKRETLNIVFSFNSASKKDMIECVNETLKDKYPDNDFCVSFHDDTGKPHCHVVLKLMSNKRKRINPRKNDLQQIREIFSSKLNELNYESLATSKKPKYHYKNTNHHAVKIVEFGEAPYLFKDNGRKSYFVTYETSNNTSVTIWGKGLKDAIDCSGVKKNDTVSIKKSKPNWTIEKVNLKNKLSEILDGKISDKPKDISSQNKGKEAKEKEVSLKDQLLGKLKNKNNVNNINNDHEI